MMKIIWSNRASEAAKEVASYILASFGKKTLSNFLETLEKDTALLAEQPQLGKIEPLLLNRPQALRSLVINKQGKIIYRVTEDTIYIVDFWDCRREPTSLASGL